jgi:hypothetical protein
MPVQVVVLPSRYLSAAVLGLLMLQHAAALGADRRSVQLTPDGAPTRYKPTQPSALLQHPHECTSLCGAPHPELLPRC